MPMDARGATVAIQSEVDRRIADGRWLHERGRHNDLAYRLRYEASMADLDALKAATGIADNSWIYIGSYRLCVGRHIVPGRFGLISVCFDTEAVRGAH